MLYKNIEIKWLGHSGFYVKTGQGRIIYIDPFKISENREHADVIFITHSHYDHCSIEDINKIARSGTILVCPADVASKLTHINADIETRIAEIGKENLIFENELRFWAVPAYNLNKPFHTREEDWVGYILDFNGVLVYHAGDTDMIPEMKNIENTDIALLPIGGTFTMNAGEAAKAASIIKPRMAIPMHYGSIEKTGDKNEANIFLKNCGLLEVEAKVLEMEK